MQDDIHRLILLFLRIDAEKVGVLGRNRLKELSFMPLAISRPLSGIITDKSGCDSLLIQQWIDLCCSAANDEASMSEFLEAADGMEAKKQPES